MVDRVPACITIGGTVSAVDFATLCVLMAAEALSFEWDGEIFEAQHRNIGEPIRGYAYEVACGRFPDLEAFCLKNALPFARWSGACPGQWGGQRAVFTGVGEVIEYPCDEDDYVVIGRFSAERLGSLEAIIDYFDKADFDVPPLVVEGDPDFPSPPP